MGIVPRSKTGTGAGGGISRGTAGCQAVCRVAHVHLISSQQTVREESLFLFFAD